MQCVCELCVSRQAQRLVVGGRRARLKEICLKFGKKSCKICIGDVSVCSAHQLVRFAQLTAVLAP